MANDPACPVIHLRQFRSARDAAAELVSLFHGATVLVKVRVEVQAGGEAVVVAFVTKATRAIESAFPPDIDGVRVVVRAASVCTEVR